MWKVTKGDSRGPGAPPRACPACPARSPPGGPELDWGRHRSPAADTEHTERARP